MPQKHTDEQTQDRLHAAALDLAARHGWMDLTVDEIYQAAAQPLGAQAPANVWPIVVDILARLDAQAAEQLPDLSESTWRDALFEMMMARFDLMQEHRDAYSDIMPAALNRSYQAGPLLVPRLTKTIAQMIETANVPVKGPARHAATAALCAIYIAMLETWRQDDQPDMAKTMAALDRKLEWFSALVQRLSGR